MTSQVHLNFLLSPEMKEMMLQAKSASLVDSLGGPRGRPAMSWKLVPPGPKAQGWAAISSVISPSDTVPQFGDSGGLF